MTFCGLGGLEMGCLPLSPSRGSSGFLGGENFSVNKTFLSPKGRQGVEDQNCPVYLLMHMLGFAHFVEYKYMGGSCLSLLGFFFFLSFFFLFFFFHFLY